ncbi:hypothetical protein HDC91_000782 [Mucilaginibacter sp. AK015]|nr:hypothetical protein [Mucilaginibacter sp. AK015]
MKAAQAVKKTHKGILFLFKVFIKVLAKSVLSLAYRKVDIYITNPERECLTFK